MKRLSFRIAFAALLVAGSAPPVMAQPRVPGGPTVRPPFSPYLNLARPGGTRALNYYGLVRPEMQFRQSLQNLQGAVATNQQAIGDAQGETPTTGHQTQFLNLGGFFLNSSPSAGGQAGASTSRPGGGAAAGPTTGVRPATGGRRR